MYQQIFIENQPVYIPNIGFRAGRYQFNPSTYFIRGKFFPGHYSVTAFYSRLGELVLDEQIKSLSAFHVDGGLLLDNVFFFDAPDSLGVMKLIVRLNEACVTGYVQPLPDLEFVHPAAHALLYSLGGFCGNSDDCYLHADPEAVDLNRKVR
jgi:hypothetical protein